MPIIIAGTIDLDAENREKALNDAADLMADTRSQRGCNHYVWSSDPTSKTRVYVYENWETTEDLAAHLSGKYYSGMLAILGAYNVQNVDVSKFQISREQAVYDPQGVARADFFDE
ncbi:MAG: putative quinol monooxygenase [Pseudomonadales bacterium]